MVDSRTDIIQELIRAIEKHEPAWLWYVGVSANAERQLVQAHNVRLATDIWLIAVAVSLEEAQSIETYIRGRFGIDGDPAYGFDPGREVYAYCKDAHTHPDGYPDEPPDDDTFGRG